MWFFLENLKQYPIFGEIKRIKMTELGKYFKHKSVNKSEISRKTGISSARLSELSRNEKTQVRAEELYLIALALDISPIEIIEKLFGNLELKN